MLSTFKNSDTYSSIKRKKVVFEESSNDKTPGNIKSIKLPTVKQEKTADNTYPRRPSLRRVSSVMQIRKQQFIGYIILGMIVAIISVDALRTFFVDERALLTRMGRQRYRTRRRVKHKARFCDETDEPKVWKLFTSGWRSLSTCEEFDLSLRRQKLGDNGVKRLMGQLGRKEYANGNRRGKLRVLNLQRQGITRRGAGYISRWLSADPLEVNADTAHVVDVDRIPTAAATSIFINLEGNPIDLLGFKDLKRAVEKAKLNGIKVVIVGGDGGGSKMNGNMQHVVKLGPVTYQTKRVSMEPWRLPVPLIQRMSGKDRPFVRTVKSLVILFVGVAVGRTTAAMRLPYRLAIVRNDA